MFCKNCGTKLEEGTVFCPKCGARVEGEALSVQTPPAGVGSTPKPKKKKKKFILIALAAVVVLVFAAAMSGGSGTGTSPYIEMIQNGYLGEYTDVTVKELLEADVNFGLGVEDGSVKVAWTSNEVDGVEYVCFYAYMVGEEMTDGQAVLFQVCSDDTFKLIDYGYEGDNYETTEVAYYANQWYENWYVKNVICNGGGTENLSEEELISGMQTLIQEKFDQISGSEVLYGASADYTGDRADLCSVVDQSEPLSLTVTELINYYADDELAYYMTSASENTQTEEMQTTETDKSTATEEIYVLTYGSYGAVTEDGITLVADLGYYTDVDGNYLDIYTVSDEGEYAYVYSGTLTEVDGNLYEGWDDALETTVWVTLTADGFILEVDGPLIDGMVDINGAYTLESVYELP